MQKTSPAPAILWGGAAAGTLDIVYAILFYGSQGASPTRILQSIATGVMGRAAYQGGFASATLGLCLHYLIATIFAAAFWVAAGRFRLLVRRPIAAGLVYGFGIYWVMNLVVLPLSAFPRQITFPLLPTILGLVIHMLLIGLPIAWLASRHARQANAETA